MGKLQIGEISFEIAGNGLGFVGEGSCRKGGAVFVKGNKRL
jgi:hypothetical protein